MTAPSNPRLSLFALSGLALAALPGAAQTPLTTTLVASGLDQPLSHHLTGKIDVRAVLKIDVDDGQAEIRNGADLLEPR